MTLQSWLWSPPAKHSTRQIEDLLERIAMLYALGIHRHFADDLLRRYARRLANRPPSIGARIKEPLRTIESAYFLRYCLLIGTDRLWSTIVSQKAANQSGYLTMSNRGRSEYLVIYGGLQVGLSVLFLLLARNTIHFRLGLLISIAVYTRRSCFIE